MSYVIPIRNYDYPVEPFDYYQYPAWIWYNDEGGYDD